MGNFSFRVVQEDMFKVAGVPMVENCIAGYNSCMFAYGQVNCRFHLLVAAVNTQVLRLHYSVFTFHFQRLCLQNYLLLLDWKRKNTYNAW